MEVLYEISIVYIVLDNHELKPVECLKRQNFCIWLLLTCSYEAYFYRTKSAKRHNNRLWLKTRSTEDIVRRLHDKKVLVSFFISTKWIFGPYFFEHTVDQDSFIRIVKSFFWSKVVIENYKKSYFQKDGAKLQNGGNIDE